MILPDGGLYAKSREIMRRMALNYLDDIPVACAECESGRRYSNRELSRRAPALRARPVIKYIAIGV